MANPKWEIVATIDAGSAMHALACAHRPELEPRLEAGLIDGLPVDVETLRGKKNAAERGAEVKKAATATQDKALVLAATRAVAMRDSLRRAYTGEKDVLDLFGLGRQLNTSSVSSVASAVEMLIAAAEAHPARVRSASILPADIEGLRTDFQTLVGADVAQQGKKVSAKEATAARKAAQLRVERAIDQIVCAARLAFVGKPEIVRSFEALVPTRTRAKTKKPATATKPA